MLLPGSWAEWVIAGVSFAVVILVGALLFSVALRKTLRRGEPKAPPEDDLTPPRPRSEDQAAFLTASMQGVIQQLHEKEKEVQRLHRLERERAQQTERWSEAVTRNMPTGLLMVNAAGLVTISNPAAETALAVGALNYRRYRDLLGPESPLGRLLAECLRDGRTFQREEVEHTTPAGEARKLGVTISPILPTQAQPGGATPRDAPAKVTGALCLLSDLTELDALQREVRLKENLAALGEMSAGIAHEFKNALATIAGYAQMIRSEAGAGELAESANRILNEARALTHVVTEFLRFARPLELSREVVPLGPLVARVVTEVAEAMPQVGVKSEGEFGEVSGDEGLLRQVLLNLVRNAAEAVSAPGAGGWVKVCGTLEENAGRPVQRVAIADNGPGIPPADLPKLFLPFYTTKIHGTGLGLAIVLKIALQHGGGVEARNLPGGGAEFNLWLPLAGQAVDSPAAGI